MDDVKIIREEILSDEKYTLKRYTVQKKNSSGEWKEQRRDVFDHGNAATVLLYNPDEKTVLLTRQFRLATYVNGNPSGLLIETPAGLLEEGEAPEQTMLREIKEETGYEINDLKKICEAYSSAGAFTELIHFYAAPYRKSQKVEKGGGLKEEGEDITVLELPFSEALRLLDSGEIIDLKTIMLLRHAQATGLLD